jgi:hypothetical protein
MKTGTFFHATMDFQFFFSEFHQNFPCLEVCSRANFATWFKDWWPHHGDLLELSIVIPVRLVAYGLVFQKTMDNSSWQTIVR